MTALSEIDKLFASTDPSDQYSAIIRVGKQRRREYEARVVLYLGHDDAELRKAAIQTLTMFWRLPEYEAKAREMARSEPDDLARGMAVLGWASYHDCAKDPELIRTMLGILLDPNEKPAARSSAHDAVLTIAGIAPSRFPLVPAYPDIEGKTDWALVLEMVTSAGVEAPPALVERAGRSRG